MNMEGGPEKPKTPVQERAEKYRGVGMPKLRDEYNRLLPGYEHVQLNVNRTQLISMIEGLKRDRGEVDEKGIEDAPQPTAESSEAPTEPPAEPSEAERQAVAQAYRSHIEAARRVNDAQTAFADKMTIDAGAPPPPPPPPPPSAAQQESERSWHEAMANWEREQKSAPPLPPPPPPPQRPASVEESAEEYLAEHPESKAAQFAPGATASAGGAEQAPMSPEMIVAQARAKFVTADTEREKHRRKEQRSPLRMVREFFGAKPSNFKIESGDYTAQDLQEKYLAAEREYYEARLAYGKNLLSDSIEPEAQRRMRWIGALDNERNNYELEYERSMGEKMRFLRRAAQWYGGMPKPARIAATAVIASAFGTGAGLAGGMTLTAALMSLGFYRAARSGASALGIGVAVESLGHVRGNRLEKTQTKEKENIVKEMNLARLDEATKRVDKLAQDKIAYDRKTGLYKLLLAVGLGGVSSVVSYFNPISSGGIPTTGTGFPHGQIDHSGEGWGAAPAHGTAPAHVPPTPPHAPPVAHPSTPTAPSGPGTHAGVPGALPEGMPTGAAELEPVHFSKIFMPKFEDVHVHAGDNLTKILKQQFDQFTPQLDKQSWFSSLSPGDKEYFVNSYVKWFEHMSASGRDAFGLGNVNHIEPGQVLKLHLLNEHPEALQEFMKNFAQLNPSQMHHLDWMVQHPESIHHAAAYQPAGGSSPADHLANELNREELQQVQSHPLPVGGGRSGLPPAVEPHLGHAAPAPAGGVAAPPPRVAGHGLTPEQLKEVTGE